MSKLEIKQGIPYYENNMTLIEKPNFCIDLTVY